MTEFDQRYQFVQRASELRNIFFIVPVLGSNYKVYFFVPTAVRESRAFEDTEPIIEMIDSLDEELNMERFWLKSIRAPDPLCTFLFGMDMSSDPIRDFSLLAIARLSTNTLHRSPE